MSFENKRLDDALDRWATQAPEDYYGDREDGDKLVCIKCDRFVSELNSNSLCLECAGEEE